MLAGFERDLGQAQGLPLPLCGKGNRFRGTRWVSERQHGEGAGVAALRRRRLVSRGRCGGAAPVQERAESPKTVVVSCQWSVAALLLPEIGT